MSHTKHDVRGENLRGLRIAFLVLCTVGVCLSADLLRLHVNVHTNPDYQSFCAVSERVNCDAVSLSDSSVQLGLPLAVWGLLGYLVMGALAIWGLTRQNLGRVWPYGLLSVLGVFSALVGVALFVISKVVVESLCIVCMTTYVISVALAVIAIVIGRRMAGGLVESVRADGAALRARPRPSLIFAGVFALLLALVWWFIPPYWLSRSATGPGGLEVGVTEEGHVWIGATDPVLEIVEYSDYQCPFCQRGHLELRELVQTYPHKVRLVHRHFPLDIKCNRTLTKPFHGQACDYAKMAFCAERQGKFWEANDYLYAHGRDLEPIQPDKLAGTIGIHAATLRSCLSSHAAEQAIQGDLLAGQAHGIRGTPTFVVEGAVFPGRIPPDVLERALGEGTEAAAHP